MTKQEVLNLLATKGITELELLDKSIKQGDVAKYKHVYRALLHDKCGLSVEQIAEETLSSIQTVKLSLKKADMTLIDDLLKPEIKRETDEEFDERFYSDGKHTNPRTNLPYFPAYHFLMSVGAPENYFLGEFKKDKGHYSDMFMHQRERIGTFVHDAIDDMIKHGIEITDDMIAASFSNPKDRRDVKKGLSGFIRFCEDYQPQIIAAEKMLIAEDWAGTIDLICRLNIDDYQTTWIVDYKTSKAVYDDHKMQVEAYRRATGSDKCAVLILGNQTKKMYTFSEVKKDNDFFYDKFLKIKEVAYAEMVKNGQVQPRTDFYVDKFSIQHLNLKFIQS